MLFERGNHKFLYLYMYIIIIIGVCVFFLQSSPQIKAQLPSNATACYALAVNTEGNVR